MLGGPCEMDLIDSLLDICEDEHILAFNESIAPCSGAIVGFTYASVKV